ncbi:MAG: tetratricopeptide (TPR) repeat protein [Planctomycetota bacterium]|jgi:tetratricopeptide (TPR) repeat protein
MIIPSASLSFLLAFASSDGWEEVHALEPGRERGQAIAALLAMEPVALDPDQLKLAWEAGKRAAEGLELELALEIQRPLFELEPAEWSGINLAITLQRLGDWRASDAVMGTLLNELPLADPAGTWSQRGIFALGAGELLLAREYLGRALCLGSADASGILAREDLARHNIQSAKAGFRAALTGNPEHPWALRGWGLSLLGASPLPTGDKQPN